MIPLNFKLDQIADVGVSPSENLKLISREIIFEVFHPVWKTYLNVTDTQKDGQTDDMLWHNRTSWLDDATQSAALCVASSSQEIIEIVEIIAYVFKLEWDRWNRRICRFPVALSSYVSEITSALIAHYDNTPFWIPAETNKDDLEWPWMPDST